MAGPGARDAEPRRARCAIYTRKSSEEGLEQAYNSLDAQYDACAAYVASQRHEGWTLAKERYDDGGFSGGTMARPGLERLLADVAAGKVQVIVLYKIDRLTRSLSDFSRIVEVLEKAGASFVSVTQSFNTTTSMGRLMLNVLLSFAQFEREVTGERIRDKIAASKAKGLWMGGNVPLGYRVVERRLVIDEADAATVRMIFSRYAALGSGRALIAELREQGCRTKVRPRADGPARGGVPFERGMLFHLLANRIYLGEIVHKGVAYPGDHAPIIQQDLWDPVQQRIAANSVERGSDRNVQAPSLLTGLLIDGHGRRMSPSHAVKSGRRYRYYITPASELRDGGPPAWRLPAHDVEVAVVQRLRTFLEDRTAIRRLLPDADAAALAHAIEQAGKTAQRLAAPYGRRTLVATLVAQVRLDDMAIGMTLDGPALARTIGIAAPPEPIVLTMPATKVRTGKAVKLVLANNDGTGGARDDALVALLAEAQTARKAVLAAPDSTIKDVAATLGQCRHRLSRLVRLSYLAPDIVRAIATGRQPASITARQLLVAELPLCWHAQKQMLGVA